MKAEKKIGALEATITSVALFDVLYNVGKADPFVLTGINHLHHAQGFENLGDLTTYLKTSIIDSNAGTEAWRQMVHKYKGYTGEEAVFDHIRDEGLDLEVPTSGTNPDVDAVIDGQAYDMAITDNPSYIQEKLDSLPDDVNIWTNKEMGAAFGDNPRVYIDESMSSGEMFDVTYSTFEGIKDLGDFMENIPAITLGFSGIRNARGVIRGDKQVGDAIEQTLLDTAGVGFGGLAGSKLGLAVGLLLAPLDGGTTALYIIGSSVGVGTVGGIVGGKSIVQQFKSRHLRGAANQLRNDLKHFSVGFEAEYETIQTNLDDSFDAKFGAFDQARKWSQNRLMRILYPSVMARFYQRGSDRMWIDHLEASQQLEELRDAVENDHEEGGLLLYSQGKSILMGIPEVEEDWDNIEASIKRVERERKKIS